MKCPKCKSKINKDEKFCGNCGKEIISKNRKMQAIIACICCFAITLTSVVGCIIYQKVTDTKELEQEAINVVDDFLVAYKNKDENASQYLLNTSLIPSNVTYGEFQGYCAEKINYKIVDVSTNDSDFVVVNVEIENIDLDAVLNELNEKTFDNDEEIIKYFYSLIQSDDAPTCTYQCNIKCKKYPIGMKILFDAELSNALLGGYSAFVAGNNE